MIYCNMFLLLGLIFVPWQFFFYEPSRPATRQGLWLVRLRIDATTSLGVYPLGQIYSCLTAIFIDLGYRKAVESCIVLSIWHGISLFII